MISLVQRNCIVVSVCLWAWDTKQPLTGTSARRKERLQCLGAFLKMVTSGEESSHIVKRWQDERSFSSQSRSERKQKRQWRMNITTVRLILREEKSSRVQVSPYMGPPRIDLTYWENAHTHPIYIHTRAPHT